MSNLTLSEWIEKAAEYQMRALFEYYEYLTGKEARTKDKNAFRKQYVVWYLKNEKELNQQIQLVKGKFNIFRDKWPFNCFFEKK